jgi:GTP cyclohydrolase I
MQAVPAGGASIKKMKTKNGYHNKKKHAPLLPEDRILNCSIQDEGGLNDFQKLPDTTGIAIDKVGINNFRIPLNYRHADGTVMNHDTQVSAYVHCQPGKTGINMSRLCEIVMQEAEKGAVDLAFFKRVLSRFRSDLRDHPEEPMFADSYLKLRLQYPVKQETLKSQRWGWQYYPCTWSAQEDHKGQVRMFLGIQYEYSSTCPCSLSMAKQYEAAYASGKTQEGSGIAVGHSQRSGAQVTIEFDAEAGYTVERLVDLLRHAIPTETQSLAKRMDEQAFAVLNGSVPMFVEHATRRLHQALNGDAGILDWVAAVEHWESLHSHNAVGVIRKGVPGGLL